MDGSAFTLSVGDFYRPLLRKFSPMTRDDLITRTGASAEAVMRLVRSASRKGHMTASGHAQNIKPIYYTLTPEGEKAALAMLFPLGKEKRKITAVLRK